MNILQANEKQAEHMRQYIMHWQKQSIRFINNTAFAVHKTFEKP